MTEPFAKLARAFLRDEGSLTVEAVIMLPTLILFDLSSFTFFDAYRTQTVLIRGTYVVSDLLSRETDEIGPNDIAGMGDVFEYLTFTPGAGEIRVTEVWREVDDDLGIDRHVVAWSHGTGGMPDMTPAELVELLPDMPTMAPKERLTVLETFTAYNPPFFVGLPAYTMETMVVAKQRDALRLCFVETGAVGCS